ncbi:dTDP-4-dehydrorhamnose reductase [Mucilaginibacter pallidiroseus]|uniref:dTDP-4-dehydrorhamnose reductase n=1 Tax=Mucilaginibacter pallidiroseus TaxID=2599295 RepID=A0A563UCZ9_9SPHI|nr:dTDP-4-dehydrorhamnose reductase [Mucilaginibacter pallidiroseus]TWR29238.1 dTDP-4-dehydrorhamnose reductase [Mucilaginibacter pallidiroseus]
MNKTIIFGASGQLGQCFRKIAADQNIDSLIFPDETEANILDGDALEKLFEKHSPNYAVNCAAYTAVDKAEDDADTALKINKTGVENIARLAAKYSTTLVQVSTDFVFKGDVSSPLTENDKTEPISVYGQTKLDGELVIPNLTDKYFVVRTAWLYSEFGNNFVKTMLKFGAERDELKIIADQVGTPTYAMDLADAILTIIESGSAEYGIYHYSNEGVASWYDFTKAIFDIAGLQTRVLPIPTSDYVTRAVRPPYSVMSKLKIKKTFGINIPYWRESLALCISKLKQ